MIVLLESGCEHIPISVFGPLRPKKGRPHHYSVGNVI